MDEVEVSGGNIFADLEVSEPEEHLAKAQLAVRIIQIIEDRGLSQTTAAEILGIDQPKISALKRGRLKIFSLDRLCRFLNRLDMDVEIVVKRKSQEYGGIHVCS